MHLHSARASETEKAHMFNARERFSSYRATKKKREGCKNCFIYLVVKALLHIRLRFYGTRNYNVKSIFLCYIIILPSLQNNPNKPCPKRIAFNNG